VKAEPVEFATERLSLSPPTPDDAAFVLELLNDPGWLANIGDRGVRTLEDARAYIVERFEKSLWLVVRDAAGEPVGMCGLVERDGLDSPDIGYAYLARHSGKGYATEAARVVLRHAREVLGLPKVAAITSPGNTASQRVLEKIGLRFVQMMNLPGHDEPSAYFTT
jgi:RimJ/RimL family protein N-acetyltransferase